MRIKPARAIGGSVKLSGDKSISHRAAMIAAMAHGTSLLSNYSTSQDCASTLNCLRELGVSIVAERNDIRVTGRGPHGFTKSIQSLNCGNSGSTMRMLAGVLAGQKFSSSLTGDSSLRSRPMGRIIEPLELMGARIDSENGKPPLIVSPDGPLRGINYELPVSSAQVKSCLLFAGLQAEGRTTVVESQATRDHTERMLRWYGAPIETKPAKRGVEVSVSGPAEFSGREVNIPGDVSSAAFLVAAAALLPESELTIRSVGLNPTRTQFLSELQSCGANITLDNVSEVCNEPVGDLYVAGPLNHEGKHSARKQFSGELIPLLIDELPLLAVVGTQLPGGCEIRDAAELRIKESDRIAATIQNLRAMGAEIEEYPDGLAIGPAKLKGAQLDSRGDHRIALACAVAALMAEGESEIRGAECVAVSFPDFFDLLESLARA